MQYLMKNLYNFKNQITHIDEICQTNILLAEAANCLLKRMSPHLISYLCEELEQQYEQEYLDKDEDKLHSIRQVLNLLKRDQVTNVDELCMDIRQDLNSYYDAGDGVQHIKCRKYKPYDLRCNFCRQFVSNHVSGLKSHLAKCEVRKESQKVKKESQLADNQAILYTSGKKTKKVDTEHSYEQRQNRLNGIGEVTFQLSEERISKKQMMALKRERKLEENKKKIYEDKRKYDNDQRDYYCQQDDDQLAKKNREEQLANQQQERLHSDAPSMRTIAE